MTNCAYVLKFVPKPAGVRQNGTQIKKQEDNIPAGVRVTVLERVKWI